MTEITDRPRRIHSNQFFAALCDAGIFRTDDYVSRIVIDCQVNKAVVVHVERFADDRLLDVVRTLDGIEVHCGHEDHA